MQNADTDPVAVTVLEAAKRTRLRPFEIRDEIRRGVLPCYFVCAGRKARILLTDLERWMRSYTELGQELEAQDK